MIVRMATRDEMKEISDYSVRCGNIPLVQDQALSSVLMEGKEVVGFAAVQAALHAAGSYVDPRFRGKGLTYGLRAELEKELKRLGFPVYFALPGNDFEKMLFAKYGPVSERLAQIKEL